VAINSPRALGERLHADRVQHVVGRAQLPARVDAPALAAQPLPVQQVRAGQLRTQPGPAQPVDRLAVELVGGRPAAQQRPAVRLQAQPKSLPPAWLVSASCSSAPPYTWAASRPAW
jgi:hypothetical protein